MQKFLCKACILSNGQQGRTPLENTDSYIRMLFVDLIKLIEKKYIYHIYINMYYALMPNQFRLAVTPPLL